MPKIKNPKRVARVVAPNVKFVSERIEDRWGTVADLSRKMFNHKDMLARSIRGEREFKAHELIELARHADIPLSVLARQLGYDVSSPVCDVIGIVNGEGRVRPLPRGYTTQTLAPIDPPIAGKVCAVIVEAPRSRLSAYNGNELFFEKMPEVIVASSVQRGRGVIAPGSINGQLSYIVISDAGGAVIGHFTQTPSLRTARITVLGGHETIDTDELEWAVPILWIKMGR